MEISYITILISILAATLSGFGTAIVAGIRDAKREKNRREEKEKDQLRLDIKDLKIELYQLEKELTEWKDKYYKAIQDLIEMKSELDSVISQLNHLEYHEMLDTE
jgi:predicted RNase H-like nuclease (RuvC/YqgF family)